MSAAVCTLPDRRGKSVLVMGRKPGGVVEGAIRDAGREHNYSIRSEEKGGRRGECRVSDSFGTQKIRCGMSGCRRYLLPLHSQGVCIPLRNILDKEALCLSRSRERRKFKTIQRERRNGSHAYSVGCCYHISE